MSWKENLSGSYLCRPNLTASTWYRFIWPCRLLGQFYLRANRNLLKWLSAFSMKMEALLEVKASQKNRDQAVRVTLNRGLPISDLISQLSATETPNLKSGASEIQQGRKSSKAAKRSFLQLKKQEVDDDFVVLPPTPPESVKASSSDFSLGLCCTPTQRGVVAHMVYNMGTYTDAQAADMLAQYHQVPELALSASTEDPERVLYTAGPADVR